MSASTSPPPASTSPVSAPAITAIPNGPQSTGDGLPIEADLAPLVADMRLLVEAAYPPGALEPYDAAWLTDHCLARYLRAREKSVPKAFKMLQETVAWRKSFGVAKLMTGSLDVVIKEGKTGKIVVHGWDKSGRAVIILRPKHQNTKAHDPQMQHLVYSLERVIMNMRKGQEKLVLLLDFAGYSLFNAPSFKTQKETLNILQNHYPERLGQSIMVDAPTLFWASFKMVKPFIDPVTVQKIKFFNSEKYKPGTVARKYMDENFNPSEMMKDYGGDIDYKYNVEEYMKERWIPFYCQGQMEDK